MNVIGELSSHRQTKPEWRRSPLVRSGANYHAPRRRQEKHLDTSGTDTNGIACAEASHHLAQALKIRLPFSTESHSHPVSPRLLFQMRKGNRTRV
jgi:hypothetical protein